MSASALIWAAAQPAGSPAARLYAAYTSGVLTVRAANGETATYNSPEHILSVLSNIYTASVSTIARRPTTTIARLGGGA